jgi:hypothetical protein
MVTRQLTVEEPERVTWVAGRYGWVMDFAWQVGGYTEGITLGETSTSCLDQT